MERRKFINLLGLAPFVAKFGIGIKPDKLIIASTSTTVDIPVRTWAGLEMLTPEEVANDIISAVSRLQTINCRCVAIPVKTKG